MVHFAQAAISRVESLQTEAAKAKAVAERHQEMVASLTADNLVFLMRLKRCEGDLVSAVQERDELRLAVEEQRGPWFEEVANIVDLSVLLPATSFQSRTAFLLSPGVSEFRFPL